MRRTRLFGFVLVFTSLGAMGSLTGCTAPTRSTQALSATALGSTVRPSAAASGPLEVIVGAGESITIRDALQDRTEYFCETGYPLSCSGLGRARYCFCPHAQ